MSVQWPFTNLGMQFFQGQLPQLIKNIGRLADELKRYNDRQTETPERSGDAGTAPWYIEAARKRWEREGEIEIDDDPKVSAGDDPGAYVQAWVWVSNEEAGLPGGEE